MNRRTAWGVLPETLAAIANLARGALTPELHQRVDRLLGFVPDPPRLREWLLEPAEAHVEASALEAARPSRDPVVNEGIAVIPLRGLITPHASLLSLLFGSGGGLQGFRESFRKALANSEVTAILLDVDSPGGLIDLIPETAAEIREARGAKPIAAIANTEAASAAYWIAAQADELHVTPSGQVGSIGVFMLHEDFSEMDRMMGVTTTLISAGKFKTEGNPYEPLSDEAREAMQESVDEIYGKFVADVAKGRGVGESAVRNGFGEGRMVLAEGAVSEGMADSVVTYEALGEGLQQRAPQGGARAEEISHATKADAAVESNRRTGHRALQLARPQH